MIDYALILSEKFGDKQWSLNGDDFLKGFEWLEDSKAPTKKQLDDMWQDVLDIIEKRKQDKLSAYAKLGLTQDEINAIL